MKILLVGNYLPDAQQSMQRFGALLGDELRQRGHEVQLLRPQSIINRRGAPPAGRAKWLGYIDKFVLFPRVLKRAAKTADIVHICDHSNAPYTRFLQSQPHLVTCHDVLAIRSALGQIPENPTRRSGQWLQKYIVNGLNQARHIVCDSQQTQRELLQVSRVEAARSEVITLGLNFPYRPLGEAECASVFSAELDARRAQIVTGGNYVLHIGGNDWYKNRAGVLRISKYLQDTFAAAEAPFLVMAGSPLPQNLRDWIAENQLSERIVTIENCSNQTLQALYSRAQCLLFPSLAEGFGWPIIEAQACGCRVAASNFAPLTEVGGNSAVYFEPRDEIAAAHSVRQLWEETPEQKEQRVGEGLRNVARFSNAQMMENYLAMYRKLLS